jgi:3-isopropylmalate/(R)-2-methylmalate dehydratase small subunit
MRVWKYGDDINTDMLFPGKYTYTCGTLEEIRPHLLEDLDAEFAGQVQAGDLLFVGRNFGCGSSREQPALGLRGVGIGAVVGCSFARIFYRASINQGLVLLECPDAVEYFEPGMAVELRLEQGEILIGDKVFSFPPLPPEIMAISEAGGLLNHARAKLRARAKG